MKKYETKWNMTANRVAFFLVFIFLCCIFTGQAKAAGRTIRVGYVQSTNFAEGKSDEDYKSGYAYEYLQKVAYYTNWQYEYVYGDLPEMLDKLSRGEIDILPGISYTPERAKQMDFTNTPMGIENYYIYVWKNSSYLIESKRDFQGLKIGCIEDSMQERLLTDWKDEVNGTFSICKYSGNHAMYHAFSNHEVDAVVDTDNAILPSDGLVPVQKIGSSDYYLAVSKSALGVQERLNTILAEINSSAPNYLSQLHEKYFSQTAVNSALSAEEREWLRLHPVVKVGCAENYMPYCGVDENGQVTGFIVDFMKELFDLLAVEQMPEIEYQVYRDQKDVIAAVRTGKVDMCFPIYGDIWFSGKEEIFQTSDIVNVVAHLVYKGDYEDLSIQKIGVSRYNLIQEIFSKTTYQDAELVYYDTVNECLNAVLSGEVDCTITNGTRTDALLSKNYYMSLHGVEISDNFPICIGVKRGETGLLTLLNHGIHAMNKDVLMQKVYKYLDDINELTLGDLILENIHWILLGFYSIIILVILLVWRDNRKAKRYLAQEQRLAKELEKALEEAKKANHAKTIFLNNMSHDIRTPMNAIIGFTRIAKKQNRDEEVGKCLDKISSSSDHLLTLINDVLDLSRVESGVDVYTPRLTNLCAITDTVLDITQGFLNGRQIDFVVERPTEDGHCGVFTDSVRLREILVNILSNAVKFTPDGGRITFSMGVKESEKKEEKDGRIRIWYRISDTGCGMSEEFLPHVFDEFSQENQTARTNYNGTGLGMAIAKRYVDLLGGIIRVESRQGEGTSFYLEFPMDVAEEEFDQTQGLAEDKELVGLNILLAEDNDLNAEIAINLLREEGVTITRVNNGEEAVLEFERKPEGTYDLILMDIMMPIMDGYEATRRIRSTSLVNRPGVVREDAKTIPIIAMTANAFAEDVQASFAAGMDAHIAKPFHPEEMKKVLKRCIK